MKALASIAVPVLLLIMIPPAADEDLREPSKLSLKAPVGGGNHLTRMVEGVEDWLGVVE